MGVQKYKLAVINSNKVQCEVWLTTQNTYTLLHIETVLNSFIILWLDSMQTKSSSHQ